MLEEKSHSNQIRLFNLENMESTLIIQLDESEYYEKKILMTRQVDIGMEIAVEWIGFNGRSKYI